MTALDNVQDGSPVMNSGGKASPESARFFRLCGWIVLAIMTAFLLNNYLTYWQDLPGIAPIFGGAANGSMPILWSWLQLALYAAFVLLAFGYVRTNGNTLREDSVRITNINAYLIRACFFAVLIVGLVDSAISFLRIEGFLPDVVGQALADDLGKSQFRGPYVHMPLIALSFVIGRFVFSYEQAFLADLVRFWYAALFLFASAYTLLEEGHVRVDIFYAGLSSRAKGIVNAVGSVVLGISLCTVILVIGMGGKQNIINSPILTYETTQAGFGLYVKYLMAGFLGVFAVSMMIQFVAYFLDAVADIRGEPGGRDHDSHTVQ
ncbi:permease [Labrenzia sp. CP4]|jgi:TRAP-type mannitol/chloroaromatic compound transport system permease small subunit|uniref:TRAP transporter small permease subunit n=1 Tax=Labrenzia sp. CP4 TaxID=1674922 RepID=UPI0007836856|nr:TRAP transporter small permease subunit [Labrenzia sp. CP4]AMN51778.1 permease [Labrenzia sp. CP4]